MLFRTKVPSVLVSFTVIQLVLFGLYLYVNTLSPKIQTIITNCPPPKHVIKNESVSVTQKQPTTPWVEEVLAECDCFESIAKYPKWMYIDTSMGIIQCDEEHAMSFLSSYPEYANITTPDSTLLLENFRHAKNALDRINVPFFISHGTLLGWYRECGVIKFTKDIDIGIPFEIMHDKLAEITKSLEVEGYRVMFKWGNFKQGYEVSFRRKGFKIDIFSFYRSIEWVNGVRKDVVWNSVTWENELIRRMWFPIESFVFVNFSGSVVLAPSNMRDWIELDYGSSWNNPTEKWGWWDGPQNFLDEVDISQTLKHKEEAILFGKNLLINPSFEEIDMDGNVIGWTPSSSNVLPEIETRPAHTEHGTQSLRFDNNKYPKVYHAGVHQELLFDLKEPTKVFISGWAKKGTANPTLMNSIDFMIYVELWNHKGERTWWKTWALFDQMRTDWQYKYKVIEVSDLKRAKVSVVYRNQPGTVWFDQVSFRVKKTCKNDCNYRGSCIYEQCLCYKGFAGDDCSLFE